MKRLASAIALASGVVLAFSATGAAGQKVFQASDQAPFFTPGPYSGCTVGATSTPSFNYPTTELEPFVAANPTNVSNLIGAWQQDRWSNGGAHGLTAGFSTDSGKTWTNRILPFDFCAAPSDPTVNIYNRASDPWVSIGPDGIAYAISLSFNVTTNDNGVFVSTSTDGGNSWGPARTLIADAGTSSTLFEVTQFFNDKESVTADPRPSNPGTAYAVWDRLISPSSGFEPDFHSVAFEGPTMFSKTTDGGHTWSTKQIFDPGQNNQTIGNVIVVNPHTGALYDFFALLVSTNLGGLKNDFVAFVKSTDGGSTWSGPTIVSSLQRAEVADPNNVDPRTNRSPAPIRTGDLTPSPAIDSTTGQLYVVWQDGRFNSAGSAEIAIATSTDGGATWSAPKRANTPTTQPAFTASVQVASDGTVGATYYQFSPTSLGSEPTNYFIKRFAPAAITASSTSSLETIAPNLVAGPFNMLDAPFARGYFVGDYEAIAAVGTSFDPFFAQTNCLDLSCRALSSVTAPADRTPTGNNATDIFVGTGF